MYPIITRNQGLNEIYGMHSTAEKFMLRVIINGTKTKRLDFLRVRTCSAAKSFVAAKNNLKFKILLLCFGSIISELVTSITFIK